MIRISIAEGVCDLQGCAKVFLAFSHLVLTTSMNLRPQLSKSAVQSGLDCGMCQSKR
jgi:hypothetical protein